MANKPVFFDVTGRRAARISTAGWVAAIVSTLLGIAFVTSLVFIQPTQIIRLPGPSAVANQPQLVARAVGAGPAQPRRAGGRGSPQPAAGNPAPAALSQYHAGAGARGAQAPARPGAGDRLLRQLERDRPKTVSPR